MKFAGVSAALAFAAALGVAGAASAAESVYGQINLGSGVAGHATLESGSASVHEDLKAGFFGSALVGHDFDNGFSMELEGFYATNRMKTPDLNAFLGQDLRGRAESYGALVNMKLEAPRPYAVGGLSVAPYVAAGAGYGGVTGRAGGESDSAGGFNWQAKAGLAFHTGYKVTWDLGYRYLSSAKGRFGDSATGELDLRARVHVVTLGARLNF